MSVFKRKLSGSTDGKAIKVVATATAGTLIHTAVAGTTDGTYDEVWLYAYNGHTDAVTLTLEVGGATVPDNTIVVTLASKSGSVPVMLGDFILQNGAVIRGFASVANVVTLHGFVNSMTD
jgi:hypothetical protein